MSILFLIVVIVVIAIAVWFRHEIADLVVGTTDYTIDFLCNDVWPVVRNIVITALVVGIAAWIIMAYIVSGLGAEAHASTSAKVIYWLFPIWFAAFLTPAFFNKVWIIGPIAAFSKWICGPALLIAVINLSIGLWSPEIKSSLDNFSGTKKVVTASNIDQGALKESLKKDSKIIVALKNETQVFESDGKPVRFKNGEPLRFSKGVKVRILERLESNGESEPLAKVMFPDPNGKFVGAGCYVGYVAVSDLEV